MGMFDEVVFDPALPDIPSEGRAFQTKSLDRCMDRYLVTKEGRLCLIGSGWLDDEPIETAAERAKERFDIDFHGDLRLVAIEGEYGEYTARFTHGTLEWVRPVDDSKRAEIARAIAKHRGG